MPFVKVGTRLTLVLLLTLTPVPLGYMYWSVHRSTALQENDLKRDIRATSRSLTPAMENDITQGEWDEVDEVLRRMSIDGMAIAVRTDDGGWRTAPNFPRELLLKLQSMLLPAS